MNNKLKKPSPDYLYEILAWQDFADDELEQALGDAIGAPKDQLFPRLLSAIMGPDRDCYLLPGGKFRVTVAKPKKQKRQVGK